MIPSQLAIVTPTSRIPTLRPSTILRSPRTTSKTKCPCLSAPYSIATSLLIPSRPSLPTSTTIILPTIVTIEPSIAASVTQFIVVPNQLCTSPTVPIALGVLSSTTFPTFGISLILTLVTIPSKPIQEVPLDEPTSP